LCSGHAIEKAVPRARRGGFGVELRTPDAQKLSIAGAPGRGSRAWSHPPPARTLPLCVDMPTPSRSLGFVSIVTAVIAAAGCDPGANEPPEPFGLASIQSVQLYVQHGGGYINLSMVAELTPVDAGVCPPLAQGFTATVNGTPMPLSLYDFSDAITFTCQIHELDGGLTLPETDAPLRLEFRQGTRTAVMTIASPRWPTIGPVTLSRASVPAGETFTVDVAVPDGDALTRQVLARPYVWYPSVCPRDKPDCRPGEGWQGLTPSDYGTSDSAVWFDVPVDPLIDHGEKLLQIMLSSDVSFALTIQECSGLPSCFGTNRNDATITFGPFDFDVL